MKTFLRNLFARQRADQSVSLPGRALPVEADTTERGAAMQGDIGAISLVNIFQFLSLAGLTGRLDLHSTANVGHFYFQEGILTRGVLRTSRRRLGEILVQSEVITEEQLQECLQGNGVDQPARRIGEILLERGYVEPVKLGDTLFMQMKEAFMATLSWQEGRFAFFPDQLPDRNEFQAYARIDQLLLEGMADADEAEA